MLLCTSLQKEDTKKFADKRLRMFSNNIFKTLFNVTCQPQWLIRYLVTWFTITGKRIAGETKKTSSFNKSLILLGIKPVSFTDVKSEVINFSFWGWIFSNRAWNSMTCSCISENWLALHHCQGFVSTMFLKGKASLEMFTWGFHERRAWPSFFIWRNMGWKQSRGV